MKGTAPDRCNESATCLVEDAARPRLSSGSALAGPALGHLGARLQPGVRLLPFQLRPRGLRAAHVRAAPLRGRDCDAPPSGRRHCDALAGGDLHNDGRGEGLSRPQVHGRLLARQRVVVVARPPLAAELAGVGQVLHGGRPLQEVLRELEGALGLGVPVKQSGHAVAARLGVARREVCVLEPLHVLVAQRKFSRCPLLLVGVHLGSLDSLDEVDEVVRRPAGTLVFCQATGAQHGRPQGHLHGLLAVPHRPGRCNRQALHLLQAPLGDDELHLRLLREARGQLLVDDARRARPGWLHVDHRA
mmetsp:Transcript_117380/g.310070  ORF Transcript_117380/g.310070 Transcript_117380/m.310070 type:complete len:302 (-) Transcript_117380:1263-2168(-)